MKYNIKTYLIVIINIIYIYNSKFKIEYNILNRNITVKTNKRKRNQLKKSIYNN
jgi:cell division protein FtsL